MMSGLGGGPPPAVSDRDRRDPPEEGSHGDGRDTGLATRALGCLFLSGATIGLVSLLLPCPARADLAGLYSNVALAYLGAATLLLGVRWVHAWMLHVALMLGRC